MSYLSDQSIVGVAENVDINSGSIDGVTIGGSSAGSITATTLTATGAFTSLGIDDNAASTALTINSSGDVGIGMSPANVASSLTLAMNGTNANYLRLYNSSAEKFRLTSTATDCTFSHYGSGNFIIQNDGAAGYMSFGVGSSAERMRIDSSGNVGINCTPSAWGSTSKAIEINGVGALGVYSNAGNNQTWLFNNAYYTGSWIYSSTDNAAMYAMSNGTHEFRVAASGTGGDPITWTTAMTINNSGSVGVGTSTVTSSKYSHVDCRHLVIQGVSNNRGGIITLKDGTGDEEAFISIDGGALFFGTYTAHDTIFYTNNTERLRIPSDAAGLKFPATQVASSDANTLDDYEEGTFTPAYTPTNNSFSSITYNIQAGFYRKVGSLVFFILRLRTSAITVGSASGTVYISGLPFTSLSTTHALAVGGCSVVSSWAGDAPINWYQQNATAVVYLMYRNSVNGGDLYIDVNDMGTGVSHNEVSVSGCYIAAS